MKIVVPMAGRGQRFAELAGKVKDYALPKPMIPVLDKPMVSWAIESYAPFLALGADSDKPVSAKDLIFICLKEHDEKFQVSEFLRETFSDEINLVFTKTVTNGPAETALLARDLIPPEEDIIVSDCDHHFDSKALWHTIQEFRDDPTLAGILPIIKPPDTKPAWSYVVLNSSGEVTAIKEKDPELARQRAYGVIGAYYFRRGKDFINEAEAMIRENDRTGEQNREEYYLSKIYQRLIDQSRTIRCAFVDTGYILGTPDQLDQFYEHWDKKKESNIALKGD